MADSPDGSESVGAESGDDGQLTIRIPNPKVYMARQSQWKGRRGKPRCDHCRINNLKVSPDEYTAMHIFIMIIQCDRVLPTCNHCQWATGGRECKYTPLPTPAHRGIPRCDRCRLRNLKVKQCAFLSRQAKLIPTDTVRPKSARLQSLCRGQRD